MKNNNVCTEKEWMHSSLQYSGSGRESLKEFVFHDLEDKQLESENRLASNRTHIAQQRQVLFVVYKVFTI